MPDTDRLHRWLALVANVGILIGLALVIVQIRQSTQLARSTYRSQGNDVANQVYANLLGEHGGDVIEKSVECPEELTYGEFSRGVRRLSLETAERSSRERQPCAVAGDPGARHGLADAGPPRNLSLARGARAIGPGAGMT